MMYSSKNKNRVHLLAGITVFGLMLTSSGFYPMINVVYANSISYNSIDVEGNTRIASSTILSIAAVELSMTTSNSEINSAVQRLNATGYFKSVSIMSIGNKLLIKVVENPTINQVSIEGNKKLKDAILLDLIVSSPRKTYSISTVETDAQKIADAYSAAGRIATRVTPRIIKRSSNRIDVVFQVLEGNVSEIKSLDFVGNRKYSDRRLRSVIATKRAGIFHDLFKNDTYVADRIEFDKQKLSEFYLRNGYIDFKVLSSTSDLSRTTDSFSVKFNLQEGQQYRFGKVSLVSNENDIDTSKYKNLLDIKSGKVYDPRQVERLIKKVEARLRRHDYPFVVAHPKLIRNDGNQTLDIEITLVRSAKVFVERIDIEGNSTTLDKVIRREFRIVEGDAFNQRSIQEAADRIRGLDYFSNVDIQSRAGSSSSRTIIDVDLVEKQTGSLSFGLGYSSSNGPTGTIGLTQRNFLGRGQKVSVSVSKSGESVDVSFGFHEPYFLDRDLSIGFDIDANTRSSSYIPVDIKMISFVPTLSFPTGENSRFSAYYKLSRHQVFAQKKTDSKGKEISVGVSAITQKDIDAGKQITSAIGVKYTIDKRNSLISPTAGYRFSVSQELAGLGGDVSYSKTGINFKSFRTLFNDDIVLSVELEAGFLKDLDNGSNITNRYFLGGDQLRGFDSYGLGPRDRKHGDPVGGNKFVVARLEASFPIGIPKEYGVYGGLFFDTGSVWGVKKIGDASIHSGENTKAIFRATIGASIFWDTVIGPLRFNFTRPLKKQDYDNTNSFQFTVDTRF